MQPSRARQEFSAWPMPHHIVVFIRNLKLLHLDQRKDWPGITPRTLSNSPANQRQRQKSIEWALYQLFVILDPDIAHNKLRPFFPPLEQQQSRHLRDALFWALGELKKNGELRREVSLRKSMLEDCKGEKVDELLAAFSTIVLRKTLVSLDSSSLTPAIRLSTATALSPDEQQLMFPLVLAHRASLAIMSERRARMCASYEQFSELLDKKKTRLDSYPRKHPKVSVEEPSDFSYLLRAIKGSCPDSEKWTNTLLYGGVRNISDTSLEAPFPSPWSKANTWLREEAPIDTNQNLLADLEQRVSHLQDRLREWREFGGSVRAEHNTRASTDSPDPLLGFKDHQTLTVARISKMIRQPSNPASLKESDSFFLSSVSEALARVSRKHSPGSLHPSLDAHNVDTMVFRAEDRSADLQLCIPGRKLSIPGATSLQEPPCPVSDIRQTESLTIYTASPGLELEPEETQEAKSQSTAPTLAERTRKSMSAVSLRQQQTNSQPHNSHPSFTINAFETPRKRYPHMNTETVPQKSMPHDELLDDNADYDSVFKSRPRVANSPIISPTVDANTPGTLSLGEIDWCTYEYESNDNDLMT